MKPDTHSEYRKVVFHDTTSDTYFIVNSTVQTDQTIDYEGATYPYKTIETSSASHPIYTGKHRITQNDDGRIAKFNKRFKRGDNK